MNPDPAPNPQAHETLFRLELLEHERHAAYLRAKLRYEGKLPFTPRRAAPTPTLRPLVPVKYPRTLKVSLRYRMNLAFKSWVHAQKLLEAYRQTYPFLDAAFAAKYPKGL